MKILSFYHMKGGVGKTSTVVNIAYIAALEKIPSLLIDLDPQGSASFYFRVKPSKKYDSTKLLKKSDSIDRYIKASDFDFLDILPAHLSYRNLDILLNEYKNRKNRLKRIIKPFKKDYELVFIDCPPNITLVSENVFSVSDLILIPVIPTVLSMLSYQKVLEFLGAKINKKINIYPFFSMVEKRKRLHHEIIESAAKEDNRFLSTMIPYMSDIEKMGIFRQPVIANNPDSIASQSYFNLWMDIKNLLEKDKNINK